MTCTAPRVTWVLEQQQFHFRGVLGKEGEINSLRGNGSTEWLRSAWTSLPHNKMLLVSNENHLSLKALLHATLGDGNEQSLVCNGRQAVKRIHKS